MRKAHLFEAVYRFNQGIDEAVCGVQRLKKASELSDDDYAEAHAELELRRSMVNVRFLLDLNDQEKADVDHWDREYGLLIDEPLDHDAICRLMRIVEQQRKEESKPPMVVFTEAAPPLEKPPDDKPEEPAAAA
jgi:hypothetical protein